MAAAIPKVMKGMQIAKHGGLEVLEYKTDLVVPTPKEGEVLIKNDYAGINYADTAMRRGVYPVPQLPFTMGVEGAGTIIAHGPGTKSPDSLKPGTRVAYMGSGADAEYSVAPVKSVAVLPSTIDSKTAAAALAQGLTALTLIREAHHVNKGDWILVHAAAGGMGLWLCQVLRAAGAHVIGSASTAEKRELACKNGAEVTLEYPDTIGADTFVKHVYELTGGEGVAAVFDGVGKATFDVSMQCVARKGSVIVYGQSSGAIPPILIFPSLSPKNVKLVAPSFFHYIETSEEFQYYSAELFRVLAEDKLDVNVYKMYGLDQVADAHADIEERRSTGKLLLKL